MTNLDKQSRESVQGPKPTPAQQRQADRETARSLYGNSGAPLGHGTKPADIVRQYDHDPRKPV